MQEDNGGMRREIVKQHKILNYPLALRCICYLLPATGIYMPSACLLYLYKPATFAMFDPEVINPRQSHICTLTLKIAVISPAI
jgi:hypothetical protein